MSEESESGIYTTPYDDQPYEPLALVLHDGTLAIFDQLVFAQVFNCVAAKCVDGVLSVLDADTKLWKDVGVPPTLKRVQ